MYKNVMNQWFYRNAGGINYDSISIKDLKYLGYRFSVGQIHFIGFAFLI